MSQIYQHNKEAEMLSLLTQYGKFHLVRATREDDINNGIDVYIDRRPFDLKCSNSEKITVFKKYKGNIYSPLLLHQDVPYLYCVMKGKTVSCYRIEKQEILNDVMAHWNCLVGTIYDGDGNINANVSIGHLFNEEHLFAQFTVL